MDGSGDEPPADRLELPVAVLEPAAAEALLRDGEIELVGQIVGSSNGALVVTVTRRCPDPEPDLTATAVYKPIRFERPLVDFPVGTLAAREVAAYVLSEASGWRVAPPTVLREGPAGPGMFQLWIEADETVDRVALALDEDPRLRGMALFDVIANNADRKIGHLLPVAGGHVYGVDHGLTFHAESKLRTVLWGWRGEPLSGDELEQVEAARDLLLGDLGERLRALLSRSEVAATVRRAERLLRAGRFPQPDRDRPAIPWPPY
ncbi:MAG TPA: SCO1664 family protein [Candidatus Limnocylindrales bacterium]|nr:SCO1664 family protein [Candidatus Limnocylindrales bacterium]